MRITSRYQGHGEISRSADEFFETVVIATLWSECGGHAPDHDERVEKFKLMVEAAAHVDAIVRLSRTRTSKYRMSMETAPQDSWELRRALPVFRPFCGASTRKSSARVTTRMIRVQMSQSTLRSREPSLFPGNAGLSCCWTRWTSFRTASALGRPETGAVRESKAQRRSRRPGHSDRNSQGRVWQAFHDSAREACCRESVVPSPAPGS